MSRNNEKHYFSKTVPKGFEVYTKSGMLLKSGDSLPQIFGQLENNLEYEIIQKSTDKAKTVFDYLGKFARLAPLPSKVTDLFLEKYKSSLEEIMLQQMMNSKTSLNDANKFINDFMSFMFGTPEHYGMFDYMKMKNQNVGEDKKLVAEAEKMIISGDFIKQDKGDSNYYLFIAGAKAEKMTKTSDKESGFVDSGEFFEKTDAVTLVTEIKQKGLESNLVYSPTELYAASKTRMFSEANEKLIKNYFSFDLILQKLDKVPHISGKTLTIKDLGNYVYCSDHSFLDKYTTILKNNDKMFMVTRVKTLLTYSSKFEVEDELEKISGSLKQFQLVDDENNTFALVYEMQNVELFHSAIKNADIVDNLVNTGSNLQTLEEDFAVNVLANLLIGEKDYFFSSDISINPANMLVTTINHNQTATKKDVYKDLQFKKSREHLLEAITKYMNFFEDFTENFQLYVEKGGKKFIRNLEKANLTNTKAYKLVKGKLK